MKCKTDFKLAIVESAQNLVKSERIVPKDNGLFLSNRNWGEARAYTVANSTTTKINKAFGAKIAFTQKFSDGQFIVIKPTKTLVDEYYNSYIDNYYKNNPEQVTKEGDSNPNESNVQYNMGDSVPGSKASAKTLKLAEDFLERIGVDYLALTKDEAKALAYKATGNKNTILYGAADMTWGIAGILEGKDDVALTEESIHFATAIIRETNPKLYKELFNKIGQYKIYDLVKNDPSYREAYRDKEGKLDIAKLKKEAIDKLITEYVLRSQGDENLVNDFTQEGMNPQEIAFAKSWWNKIIDWFKQLFQKANIDTKDPFQEVARKYTEGEAIGVFDDVNPKDYELNAFNPLAVQATLKVVHALQQSKAQQYFNNIYKKGNKEVFYNKLMQDLGVPKQQVELLKAWNEKNNPQSLEDMEIGILSEMSYTVEIETAKGTDNIPFIDRDGKYYIAVRDMEGDYREYITKEQYDEYVKNGPQPSSHYSYLTVPGGTNYTENEIKTPGITPSIKGHAQFSTDSGIGWFRSDDKEKTINGYKKDNNWLNSESGIHNVIEPTDKIIFGHPGIGKTYLREHSNNVIDFDSDYKNKINEKYHLEPGFKARNEWRKTHKELWNKTIRELWEAAKKESRISSKILVASDMILLREFHSDFDKILTMSDKTFVERAKQRNDYTEGETESWKNSLNEAIDKLPSNKVITTDKYLQDIINPQTKTRRILELQSDLFQKGRDRSELVFQSTDGAEHYDNNFLTQGEEMGLEDKPSESEIQRRKSVVEQRGNNNENKFLQLLNKDSNWVTFFVKSIVQDSAKKGYEKVLFPTGNTASLIEGHETLEQFKKQKEDRLVSINDSLDAIKQAFVEREYPNNPEGKQGMWTIKYYKNINGDRVLTTKDKFGDKEGAKHGIETNIRDFENEKTQLQEELERVEKEGFGALKPIHRFYEDVVGNILKKQYGKDNIERITDEYGNQWYQLSITPIRDLGQFYFHFAQDNANAPENLAKSIKETNAKIAEFESTYKINNTEVNSIKYKNQDEWSEEKQKYTENGKADINDILSRLVDENGNLREEPLEAEGVSQLNPNNSKAYSTLEQNLTERLNDKTTYPEGTKFLHNINLLDSKFNRVINVDFLAIKPDGNLDVLSWNFDKNNGKEANFYAKEEALEYIGKIKTILKLNYGVKGDIRGRAIPILFTSAVKDGDSTLKTIQIGNSKANLEENENLLPFTELSEITGVGQLDNLLEKLVALYEKIKKENTPNRNIQIEQLKKLSNSIREIQIKQSLKPAFNYVNVLAKEADILIKQFNDKFATELLSNTTLEDRNKFMHELVELTNKLKPFKGMQGEMYEYVKDDKELKQELSDSNTIVEVYSNKVLDIIIEANQRFIGDKYNLADVAASDIDYHNKFRTISQGGPVGTTLYYKLVNPIFNKMTVLQHEENRKFSGIMDKVKKWNKGSTRSMFNLIFAKDSKGKIDPTRSIDTIDKEFFTSFFREKAKGNKQWIQDNIDKDAYKAWTKQYVENRIDEIKQVIWSSDEEDNDRIQKELIGRVSTRYSTKDEKSNGWLQYEASKFAKESWYSKDYQELLKKGNEPILNLYNYIRERVDIAKDLGIIEERIARVFLPLVEKSGLQEKIIFGGVPKVGAGLIKGLTVTANDKGYGQRDTVTNTITYQLPFRFTHNFLEDNPEEWSIDLGKTMQLFNDELIRYQQLVQVEALVKGMLVLEQAKKGILTDEKGHPIIENGQVRSKESNEVNYKFLLENINDSFYGITYSENQMSANLGVLGEGWDRNFKKINNFLGYKILPENISGRQISTTKLIESFSRYFQSRVLALNIGIPISNYFGGFFQSEINGGTYFDKSDILRNEPGIYLSTTKKEEREVINQILERLYPFVEDREFERVKKTTGSKFASTGIIQDIIMKPYKWSTEAAELPIIISMLKNAIVIDGKVVNVNKYLKQKYPDRYSNIKEFEKQAKEEREQLLKEKGLIALSKVTGEGKTEKLEMPVDLLDESLLKYRDIIRNISKQALGAMDPNDRNSLQRIIWFKSFLQFKNWIPPLADVRIGGLRYAEGTDQWEYGRVRQLAKVIGDGFFKSAGRLRHILKADEKGQEYLQDFLKKKQEAYFNKYGKELTITQAEWNDITRQNIKNAMTDVMFFLFMLGLIGLAQAAVPPDDKDSYSKFSVRMLDKVYQEMSFYYSPLSIIQIANGSVMPALASLKDADFLVRNMYKEIMGQIIGDDGEVEKAHPTKYILKMFPVVNNMLYYMAVASDDFAKGMGLQISSAARQY